MTRISKPKRSGTGAKRLDLTDLRELLKDRRVWSAVGRVVMPEGATQHWQIVAHEGANVDIEIEVVLQPSQVPVTARLRGGGWWEVPALNDEVALLVPDGQLEFMPLVIGSLSSNRVPSVQAPSPTCIVIAAPAGGKVYVHDGTGGAKPLAYKSDVEAVDAKYAGHVHLDSMGSPTSDPLASGVSPPPPAVDPTAGVITNPPNPAFPVPDGVHPFLSVPSLTPTIEPFSPGASPPDALIEGTSVLEAK
jgi:hypothetical protein